MTKATRQALQDVVRILHEAGWDQPATEATINREEEKGPWVFATGQQEKWTLSIVPDNQTLETPQIRVVVQEDKPGSNGNPRGILLHGEPARLLLEILHNVPKRPG